MTVLTSDARHKVTVELNGSRRSGYVEPRMLLSDFIRHELGATGTHVGCEHGVCGACTVQIDGEPVRACLTFAIQADGARIRTVEGLGDRDGSLGVLQQCFRKHHALQCGFCTAGILLSLDAYLREKPAASETEIKELLSGHICRCTGYAPILAAALEAADLLSSDTEPANAATTQG
ncbi:MAG: (2Fe-2S)-binding protein [Pseudomonadota bacterium]